MSLFRNVSGRIGEDIATEVVSYMLASNQDYIPFQKLFFNRVLSNPASSIQLQAETITQPSFEFGKPDFIVWANDAIIVGETKLGAYLSGDNQLIRYCEVFHRTDLLRNYFPFLEPDKLTKKILMLTH
jgi:hypothetical protein